jgi:arylsulfatase A-like enzyme
LLDRLDAKKLSQRTLVIVLSDHGDEFFEHGGIGHRRNLYEEVLRVPLLARLPGVLPAGRTVNGQVTLADVMPTVLDVLKLPAAANLTGRSIMPLVRGEDDGHERTAVARLVRAYDGVASFAGAPNVPVRLASVQEAFRYGGVKIYRRREWPLFPLGLPEEQRRKLRAEADRQFRNEDMSWVDLAQFPGERGAAFRRAFNDDRVYKALHMYRRRYRELRAARLGVTAGTPSDRVRDQLQGLGYLETTQSAPVSPRDGFTLPMPGNSQERPPE